MNLKVVVEAEIVEESESSSRSWNESEIVEAEIRIWK